MSDLLGRSGGVTSVTEEERLSTKEVGEIRKHTLNIPVGIYREVEYIATIENLSFAKTIALILRKGVQTWRKEQKDKEEKK